MVSVNSINPIILIAPLFPLIVATYLLVIELAELIRINDTRDNGSVVLIANSGHRHQSRKVDSVCRRCADEATHLQIS